MPHPLDELPIHQVPLSMSRMGSTDRNFYDRCYFNAHGRDGEQFLVTGLGVYPNLGVIDAYATLRRGHRQWAVHFSDAIIDDRIHQQVGPYRIEVVEPLSEIHLTCDGDAYGIGFDLRWRGSFPAIDEERHVLQHGPRTLLDTWRFAQVGTWEGELRVDGEVTRIDPSRWVGSRDRSWGIRSVGEAEPQGRLAEETREGFWWLYVPLRFEEFAVVLMAQEDATGYRSLNDAVRVYPDGRKEQLGWPEVSITYAPGTRMPTHAEVQLRGRDGRPLVLEVETLTHVALNVGAGYGDPDWSHGQWRGRGFAEGAVYDLDDPDTASRVPFSVIDHVGRATLDGQEGWGLFEHGCYGRHDPSGFTDFSSVAP